MKSFDERVNDAAIAGVLNKLTNIFFISELAEYLENCPDIPEVVFTSKKIQDAALKYLVFALNNSDKPEQLTFTANLMKLLKIPKEMMVKTIVDLIQQKSGTKDRLPLYFKEIVTTFDIPSKAFDIKKMTKVAIADIHTNESNTHRIALWLFCADYFHLAESVRSEILKNAIGRFIENDDWTQEYLNSIIKSLGVYASRTPIEAIVRSMDEGIVSFDVDKVLWVLERFCTAGMVVHDSEIVSVMKGVMSQFDEGNVDGACKLIAHFRLREFDFDKEEILNIIGNDLMSDKTEVRDYLIKFMGITDAEMTQLIRDQLQNIIYHDSEKVLALAEKYGVPKNEVTLAAVDALIGGLSTLGRPNYVYICELIDNYKIPRDLLMSFEVIEAAKKGLLKAYSNTDKVGIGLLTSIFNL